MKPETVEPPESRASAGTACSASLLESVETVRFWLEMWANEQAEVEELGDCDIEERKTIKAGFAVLAAMPKPDDYVAWVRWNGSTFITCDSDADGAFKVCRHPCA